MKLIDLSTYYDTENTIPQPPFKGENNELRWAATFPQDGYYLTDIHISSHTGTHLDAPMHMASREQKPTGKYYLGDYDINDFYGEAVCWNIPKGEFEPIGAKDFEKANKALPIEKNTKFVLIYTGWGHYFDGPQKKNPYYLFHRCPGLDFDGADWLIEHKVKGYGQDTIGTQWKKYNFLQTTEEWSTGAPNPGEPVHHKMLMAEILLFEHLWNLDKIASKRVNCGFFPLPLKDREGAPMRAVAFLED